MTRAKPQTFAILLGGDVTPTPRLTRALAGARVIAADSGMRHAAALGVVPELWVGDFDSADAALLEAHAAVPRLSFPPEKNDTDGALAVAEALARGATHLVLVGATGGQFDHALSHATQLVALARRGVPCLASNGVEDMHPLLHRLSLPSPPGARLSVVGLTDLAGLTITNVQWPLHARDVPLGSTLTLSNTTAGDVELSLASGCALVLLYVDPAA